MNITVDVQVTNVTIFPDCARVTCRGNCEVETGTHRLLVANLPMTLDPDSVRAGGRGTARVRLLSVDVSEQHYTETPLEKVHALETQIEQVSDEIRALEDEKTVWEAHGRFLDGMRQATTQYAKGLAKGSTTVSDQADIVAFLQEQDRELHTAVRDLDQQLRTKNRTLEKLQKELKAVQSVRPRRRYQAQIDVAVREAGDFDLELSYVVSRAGWRPLYDVRLLTDGGDRPVIEVSYIAQIVQRSEQDWENVQLVVSTARPALNRRLPELHPWYIDVLRPQPRMAQVRTAGAVPESAPMPAPAQMAARAEVEEADVATADVQDGGTAVRFAVSGRSDIPSDGSPHKTTMTHFRLQPTLDYLAVPKHTDAVYRRATVRNSSSGPMLPGAANLFVDDEFIGRTRIEHTPTNGEIELLLGVEERITVEREMTRRDVDKRLLRDKRLTKYGYKIELENMLPTAVAVEIHDHLPVARHEQINVKLTEIEPAPAERSDLNLLEWQLELAPEATQTITYEFQVEHPQALQVAGLP